MIVKGLALSVLTGLAVILPASSAWAPSPVSIAWDQQTKLGYTPCRPIVTPLPEEQMLLGVLADADNGIQSGTCEIRIARNLPDDAVEWVVWHEVCHLSTMQDIYELGGADQFTDWAHQHPLFKQCLNFGPAFTNGY